MSDSQSRSMKWHSWLTSRAASPACGAPGVAVARPSSSMPSGVGAEPAEAVHKVASSLGATSTALAKGLSNREVADLYRSHAHLVLRRGRAVFRNESLA